MAVTAGDGVVIPTPASNHLLADFWVLASVGSSPPPLVECRVSLCSFEVLDEAWAAADDDDDVAAGADAEAEPVAALEAGVAVGSEAKALTKRMPWCLDLEMRSPLRVDTSAPLWTVALKWSIGRARSPAWAPTYTVSVFVNESRRARCSTSVRVRRSNPVSSAYGVVRGSRGGRPWPCPRVLSWCVMRNNASIFAGAHLFLAGLGWAGQRGGVNSLDALLSMCIVCIMTLFSPSLAPPSIGLNLSAADGAHSSAHCLQTGSPTHTKTSTCAGHGDGE